MTTATVSSKGQITIPANVRQSLQVVAGRTSIALRHEAIAMRLWPWASG